MEEVMVEPGQAVYYEVYSPVNVTVYVYERASSNTRRLLGQMQGTSFTTAVTPSVDMLEFVFSAAQSNTGGDVQFTLSDRPLAVSPPPALHYLPTRRVEDPDMISLRASRDMFRI